MTVACSAPEQEASLPPEDMNASDMETEDIALEACHADEHLVDQRCVRCPPGTSRAEGASQCRSTPCLQDQYVFLNTCLKCPMGKTNAPGDDPAGENTSCEATRCEENQRVQQQMCVSCPGDMTNEPGDDASGEDTQCDSSTCQPDEHVQAHACLPCGMNGRTYFPHETGVEDTFCTLALTMDIAEVMACINRGSGEVQCWGSHGLEDEHGNRTSFLPDFGEEVRQIVPQAYRAGCAVTESGKMWCWGSNSSGRLGDGTRRDQQHPVQVFGLEDRVVHAAMGKSHTCAVTDSGEVWCWGSNERGELGQPAGQDELLPVRVEGLEHIVMVEAGIHSTWAIDHHGKVWAWGDNTNAHLGLDEQIEQTHLPTQLEIPSPVIDIEQSTDEYSCALTSTGYVWCWGLAAVSMHASFRYGTIVNKPTSLAFVAEAKSLSISSTNGCIATENNELLCWGETMTFYPLFSDYEHLDFPNQYSMNLISLTPIGEIRAVEVGYQSMCTLYEDGQVYCTGSREHGVGRSPLPL